MASIYVSIINFTPRLSHHGSRGHVCPEMLHVFQYRRDHMRDLQLNDWSYSCLPWRLSTKTGRWMHRHMVQNGLSLLRQWSCSCPATCQRACVNQKQPMSLLYCCFVMFISTKARHWTYYSACLLFVDIEPYRLTVLRHHWHCCICSYCHNIISSGSPPVFHECTSYSTCRVCWQSRWNLASLNIYVCRFLLNRGHLIIHSHPVLSCW